MAKKHSDIFTSTSNETIKFKYVTSGFNNVSSTAAGNSISFDGGVTSLPLLANTLYDFEDTETDRIVIVCASGTVSGQVVLSDTATTDFVQVASGNLRAVDGCMMPGSPNYNPLANENDGTCIKPDVIIPFRGDASERCNSKVTGTDIGDRGWARHRSTIFQHGHNGYAAFEGFDVTDAAAGTGTVTLGANNTPATTTVTFTGTGPSYYGHTLILISTDQTSITYTTATADDFANNKFGTMDNIADATTGLANAINHSSGHNGKIIAVADTVNYTVTLTQAVDGVAGNTTVTNNLNWNGNTTVPNFSGGAEVAVDIANQTLVVKTPNTTVTATATAATTTGNTDSPTFASYTAGTAGTGTVTLSGGASFSGTTLFNFDNDDMTNDGSGNDGALVNSTNNFSFESSGAGASGTGFGNAMKMNMGAGDGTGFATFPNPSIGTGECTIELWVKWGQLSGSARHTVLATKTGGVGGGGGPQSIIELMLDYDPLQGPDGQDDLLLRRDGTLHTISNLDFGSDSADGPWRHIALTRTISGGNETWDLYYNGTKQSFDSTPTGSTINFDSATDEWLLGASHVFDPMGGGDVFWGHYNGWLDGVAIHDSAVYTGSTLTIPDAPVGAGGGGFAAADLIGDTVVVTTPSKTITATAHASATTATNTSDNPTFKVAISTGTAGYGTIKIEDAANNSGIGDTIEIKTGNSTIVASHSNNANSGEGTNSPDFQHVDNDVNAVASNLAAVLSPHADITAVAVGDTVTVTQITAATGFEITFTDACGGWCGVNKTVSYTDADTSTAGDVDLGATATNLAACLNVYDGVGASANGAVATITQAEIGSGTLVAYSDVNGSAATPATYELTLSAGMDGNWLTIVDANNVSVTYEMDMIDDGVTAGRVAVSPSGGAFAWNPISLFADDFAAAVNAQTTQAVRATANGAVVTFIQDVGGTAGNTTLLADGSFQFYTNFASGTHDEFTGGAQGDAEATVSYTDGTPDTPLSVNQTAINLAACLDGNTDLGATNNAGEVTIVQATQGAGTSVTSSLSGATVAYTDGVTFKAPRIADYSKIATMPLVGPAAESMLQAMESGGNDWDVEIAPGLPLYTKGLVPTSDDPLNWDAEFSMDFWVYFGDSDGPALSGKEWVLGSGPELFADSYAGVFGIQRDHDHATDNWILHMVGGAYKLTFADSVAIEKGAWHHIAITRASNGLFKMYQDTVALAAGAGTATNPPSGGVETFNNGRRVAAAASAGTAGTGTITITPAGLDDPGGSTVTIITANGTTVVATWAGNNNNHGSDNFNVKYYTTDAGVATNLAAGLDAHPELTASVDPNNNLSVIITQDNAGSGTSVVSQCGSGLGSGSPCPALVAISYTDGAAGSAATNDRPPTIVFAKAPASEFPPAAGPDNSKKDGYYQMHHLRIFKGTAIDYATAYADGANFPDGLDRLLLGNTSINCK